MFVFGPALLMIGDWQTIVLTAISATIGVTLLAGGLTGYFLFGHANPVSRLLYVGAAFVLINPGLMTDIVGALLTGAGVALNILWKWEPRRFRRPEPSEVPHEPIEAPESAPLDATDMLEAPAAARPAKSRSE